MGYKFNPLTFLGLSDSGSSGGGSGANTTLSNLTAPTAVNQDLLPASNGGSSLGSTVKRFDAINSFILKTTGISGYDGVNGTSIPITAGYGTIGSPGDIEFITGQNDALARGDLILRNGTEGTAGHIWTSTDTTGTGAWTAVPGSSTNPIDQLHVNATITSGGTTGNQTINKSSGTVNFGAGDSTIVVTNNLVTTSSIVFVVIRSNDATALIKNVVPGSGSFTTTLNAPATAETSMGFFVINQ